MAAVAMSKVGDLFQSEDWKKEKHVPVIDCPDSVKAGEPFQVTVSVGKEIAHPNTTEHHIRWVQVYYKPEGGKFAQQLANVEFTAHGEAAEGANQGPAYTHHAATVTAMLKKPGTLYAASFCNIHGFWESAKEIRVA
jgi:superoxide reductase